MLEAQQSRTRQKRLLAVLQQQNLDAVVVGLAHHVYYFSAHLPGVNHSPAMVIFADGQTWLTTANAPAKNTAADVVVHYEANACSTLRQDQPAVVARQVLALLKARGATRIGIDASAVTSQVAVAWNGQIEVIDSHLWQMRRAKDPDELALMKQAIACTEAMYARAAEIIEPGVPELTVFNELHAAAVRTAGEPMTALLGNDFACGVAGGPARQGRVAEAGQLYVLDLGPTFRGYFADNCRTLAVNRKPTDAQQRAAAAIAGVFPLIEKAAGPGISCRELHRLAIEHLNSTIGRAMTHHLGHGVGLQAHEFPHLNPSPIWNDCLIEGEIFTCEPGLYGPELNGGIRIENQYRVTSTGVENLVNFPLGLVW